MPDRNLHSPDERWDTAGKDHARDLERNRPKPGSSRPKGDVVSRRDNDVSSDESENEQEDEE
jgi:hypothetical protein